MRRVLMILVLLATTAAFGAVPKVTITGKVIAPDGLTYAGSINCVMSAPATAMDGGTSVRVQSTGTLTIASDGTVSGALVANDITTPVTSYTCTTRINRTPVYTQTELIYLTTGGGTVDWGAISRPGATPYTPVGVAGSVGAVQGSNGAGGLQDTGVNASGGALTATSVNGASFWPLTTALTGTIAAGTYDFGEGTYTISGAVTLSSGVHLRGRGPGKTIIQLAADRTGGSVFSVNAGSTDVSNITIEDMTIDGNDATYASSYLLFVTSGASSQLTDATFRNVTFKGIKSRALVLTSAARVKVLGCTFNGVGATNPNGTAIYGVYVGQAAKKASSDITIEGNTFTNFGGAAIQPGTASAGITIVTPASGVRINDNHFSNFVAANNYKLDAIELNGVTTDMPRQVTVSNNTFSAIKGSMVNAEASGGSSNCNAFNTDMGLIVEGNTGADVGYDDTAVHKPGIYICNAKNVVIKGNAISDTAGDGNGTIEVHTAGGTVSGNIITYTVAAASPASVPLYLGGSDIVCSGNEIRGGTYGLQAQALTNSRIEQNVLSDQLTYPMFINPVGSGDVSGIVVRSNKMSSSLGTIAHGIYTNGNITNSEFSHNTSAGFSTATAYLAGGASSNAFEFNRNATAINGTLVKSSTDLKSMPDASGTVVLDPNVTPPATAAGYFQSGDSQGLQFFPGARRSYSEVLSLKQRGESPNQAPTSVRVFVLGDSISAMSTRSALRTWDKRFRLGGAGFDPLDSLTYASAPEIATRTISGWTTTYGTNGGGETAPTTQLQMGIGGGSLFQSGTTGANVQVAYALTKVACNKIRIWYAKFAGAGAFQWRRDGGAWTTVATANASTDAGYVQVSLESTPIAGHTIDIGFNNSTTGQPGGNGVYIYGIESYTDYTGGDDQFDTVVPVWMSHGGATASRWASYVGSNQILTTFFTTVAPAQGFIALGTNDACTTRGGGATNDCTAGDSSSTFSTNMQTIITALDGYLPKKTDIVLQTPFARGYDDCTGEMASFATRIDGYRTALFALATTNGRSVWDVRKYWPGFTDANALGMYNAGDCTHPHYWSQALISSGWADLFSRPKGWQGQEQWKQARNCDFNNVGIYGTATIDMGHCDFLLASGNGTLGTINTCSSDTVGRRITIGCQSGATWTAATPGAGNVKLHTSAFTCGTPASQYASISFICSPDGFRWIETGRSKGM